MPQLGKLRLRGVPELAGSYGACEYSVRGLHSNPVGSSPGLNRSVTPLWRNIVTLSSASQI